ncbi:MAG: hypothetical protein LBP86_11460 [Azoarcus sp.]|jgi:hypothetical protein|nr:hypothetical protein [Azoarcus sp.]
MPGTALAARTLRNVDAPRWDAFVLRATPRATFFRLSAWRLMLTGGVPRARPCTVHADVVEAPLGIARGVQNKVLEAMGRLAREAVLAHYGWPAHLAILDCLLGGDGDRQPGNGSAPIGSPGAHG